MSDLTNFDAQIIVDYAQSRELRYLVDVDGNHLIRFRGDDDVPALDCWLGGDQLVANVAFYTRDRFPTEDAFAISACDGWNRTRRWPRAYTVAYEGQLEIVLDGYLIVEHGVTFDWYADFVDCYVRGACQFWDELTVARRLEAA